MTNASERHFSADYRAARDAFVAGARAAGLGVTSRVHPGAAAKDGGPLFLDTVTAGPRDAKAGLLLISATHGVEGYFGSAVQTGLLREGIAGRVPEGVRLVMVHALNPFGFSWDRRVDENNVDVNRNFVDHDDPPANADYAALADAIAPPQMSEAALAAAGARLADYARAHGAFALQAALSKGQYTHPQGLYFGGKGLSWSLRMLREVLGQELAGVARLVTIDFHTGLGERGAAELIVEDLPGTPGFARAKAVWGQMVRSTGAGDSVSAPLTGTVDAAVAAWMGDAEVTFAALEVGTRPVGDVFAALRRENWLRCHGRGNDDDAAAMEAEIRAAFYPQDAEWKRQVWGHAADSRRGRAQGPGLKHSDCGPKIAGEGALGYSTSTRARSSAG